MTPKLVLLPGMDGTGMLLKRLVAELGTDVECQVVSYPPDVELNYAELKDIAVRALPERGRAFLLGESFSGPIAISLTAAYPERFSGTILCCSFASNPLGLLGQVVGGLAAVASLASSSAIARRVLLGPDASADLSEDLRGAIAAVSLRVLRTRLRAVISVDVRAELNQSSSPLMYLQATDDRLVAPRSLNEIRNYRPDVTIARVRGPHCLLQAAPHASATAIKEFIARHSAKSQT